MNTDQITHWLTIFDWILFSILLVLANSIFAFFLRSMKELPKWAKIVILIPPLMIIPFLIGFLIFSWKAISGGLSKFWKWYYHEEDDEDFDAIF
jgi:hypothetical protein